MSDKLIRATAADNTISIVFCNLKDTCSEAINVHHLKGAVAETLCNSLIAVTLLSSTLKNDTDYVTLTIRSEGPAKGVTVTADHSGKTKGFIHNPDAFGSSVSEVLGSGILTVSKDIGLKKPYIGQLPLVTGEIADDITAYFAESEQIASSCGIGVEFNEDGTIKAAGGFLVQLLPKAPYYIVDQLEIDLARHPSPTNLLNKFGDDYEKILISMLPALKVKILGEKDITWFCGCSKEKFGDMLVTIGKDEIEDIIQEGNNTEIICDFCNKKYNFSIDEMKKIRERM